MKSIIRIFICLPLIGVLACKKDKPTGSEGKAKVTMLLEHSFGTEEFQLGKFYNYQGVQIKFTTAQFYLGKPVIVDDAGNRSKLSPDYTFVYPTLTNIDLGEMEPGHAHMFQFIIGVDSATNASVVPTDFTDPEAALAPKVNSMWWSPGAGYIFYKFEGEIDSDGDNVADQNFIYHIGKDPYIIHSTTLMHSDINAGDEREIHMEIDYSYIFNGLDLNTDLQTQTSDNMPLASRIKTNFTGAFTVMTHGH